MPLPPLALFNEMQTMVQAFQSGHASRNPIAVQIPSVPPKRKKRRSGRSQGGGSGRRGHYLDGARAAVEWRDEARSFSFSGRGEYSALPDLRAFFIVQWPCMAAVA